MGESLVILDKLCTESKIIDTQTISWAQYEPIHFYKTQEALDQEINQAVILVKGKLQESIHNILLKITMYRIKICKEILKNLNHVI